MGLIESCHGLLSRTFFRFLDMVGHKRKGHRGRDSVPAAVCALVPAIEDGDVLVPAIEGGDVLDGEAGDQAGCGEEGAHEHDKQDAEESDFVKENRISRDLADGWLSRHPMRDLVFIRLVMEPCTALLKRQLALGSDKFDQDEWQKLLAPGAGAAAPTRKLRVVVAASGELDMQFFEHQRALLTSPRLWELLPIEAVTEASRCLAFRAVSMISAEYERLIARPHRKAPFLLFACLSSDSVAADLKRIKRTKPCCLDRFTVAFMDAFDVESADGRAALLMIAMLSHVDTAHVECMHAFVRRIVTRLGAQSKRPDFLDVSSRCIARRIRRRRELYGR
eukprot:1088548-Pyramimonas_sp.AAC.1